MNARPTWESRPSPLEEFEESHNRACELVEEGRLEEAIAEFTKALSADPRDASDYRNRGILYAKLGDIERATIDLGMARFLTVDPRLRAELGEIIERLKEEAAED